VSYSLRLSEQEIPLNQFLGRQLQLQFQGVINCIHCNRKTNKSFNQGYCYPCFMRLAQCDSCIVSPEKCHFAAGTCREPEWGEQNCMIDHIVYLANTSGIKVGITRTSQVPTRWMDQGATQALEYKLDRSTVFVASNSGKTKEGVRLIRKLKAEGHQSIVGIVAHAGTPIVAEANLGYVLTCGGENAVAATKSVIEQALFTDLVLRKANNQPMPDLKKLGDAIEQVLTMKVPDEIIKPLIGAPILYWAGRNNGVAEELRLKTNEITRKKSDYLEGTYAAHGIEEVMHANEAIIVVDPFADEEEKFTKELVNGVGIPIVAIATKKTSFPTLIIPDMGDFNTYLQLCAGWSLLMEVGLANNINLDKPQRARKVGNEFVG